MRDENKNGISDRTDSLNRYIAGWTCIGIAILSIVLGLDSGVIITFGSLGAGLIAEEGIKEIFKR